MKILFNKQFLLHNIHSDAEGAYRIRGFSDIEDTYANGEPYFSLVHTEPYIEWIKEACESEDYVAEVLLTPDTWEAAKIAVGLTVLAAEQGDFAVVRPPGHHAGRQRAAGFCLFNNIAIATQKLVNEGKKVLIFDFDAHHGDGTQSIFYESDQVLYCSVHQLYAYPFSGFSSETGTGKGTGYTLNFPLVAGSGDKEFFDCLDKAIGAARNFSPDVVGVSAGFDGYHKDRILGLQYSLNAFYETGFRLRRSFSHIFAVLEGGYHDDIRTCVDKFIEGVEMGSRPSRIKYDHDMSLG
jgi:acetoin utilization deacetylase AcuC-like enzyme